MKLNELRAGVLIRSINMSDPIEVDLFLLGEIADDETYLDHLQGIRLSEEWMLRIGLVQDMESKKYGYLDFENAHIFIRLNEDSIEMRIGNMYLGRLPIKYVHQLQTLYFTLKGEDLTFKEPAV